MLAQLRDALRARDSEHEAAQVRKPHPRVHDPCTRTSHEALTEAASATLACRAARVAGGAGGAAVARVRPAGGAGAARSEAPLRVCCAAVRRAR
jgi:hypothetical protein